MNTLNIIADINTYLKTENKVILTDLLNALQAEYRHEEARKKGGNIALKRQKIAEKVLKANQKDNLRPAFFKCFTADTVLYQNEKPSGISYFEAESGRALLCPCRL